MAADGGQGTQEEEGDFGDELYSIQHHTIDDERVRGKVPEGGITVRGGKIKLEVTRLTTGESVYISFDKPEPWSNDFRFVRFLQAHGYNSASPHLLEGDLVTLRRTEDGWDIDFEEPFDQKVWRVQQILEGNLEGVATVAVLLVVAIGFLINGISFYFLAAVIGLTAGLLMRWAV